jgi:hypothetical protein
VNWDADADSFEFFVDFIQFCDPDWPYSDYEFGGEVQQQQWLDAARFITENDRVSVEGNTVTVQGEHGTVFQFDVWHHGPFWTIPGQLDDASINTGDDHSDFGAEEGVIQHVASLFPVSLKWRVGHSLALTQAGWTEVPTHVTEYAGSSIPSTICVYPRDTPFPLAIRHAILSMIEDDGIWKESYESYQKNMEWIRVFDERWPMGRPEDWMYL